MDSAPAAAGPIALVGSGEFTPDMVAVDRLLLDGRPPRAVFLPTAAGREGPERVDQWVVLDRASADDPALAAQIDGAGLVYLSGGDPGYLAATLGGSRVWDAIATAWRAGAALAGCSAGACALSAATFDVRPPLVRRPGLGVVPGVVILPHFDQIERWWPGIVDRFLGELDPGHVLIGLDERTAMVGGPHHFAVHGAGAAWVVDADGRHRFGDGEELDVALAAPRP
jgi:cyanophycinase